MTFREEMLRTLEQFGCKVEYDEATGKAKISMPVLYVHNEVYFKEGENPTYSDLLKIYTGLSDKKSETLRVIKQGLGVRKRVMEELQKGGRSDEGTASELCGEQGVCSHEVCPVPERENGD